MSKELIERLREAAAQRVASTAMIGADDLSAAADALESLGAAYGGAVEAGKALAKQAFKAEQERDALAAELKALREQEPIGYISPKTSHWLCVQQASPSSYGVIRIHCSETDSQTVPLYAHPHPHPVPVPARELSDETIQRYWDEVCKDTRKPLDGADTSVSPAPSADS